MKMKWLPTLLVFALCFACETTAPPPPAAETSVKPGINDNFLAPDVDVAEFTDRFEGESREIAVHHEAIADAIGLQPGDSVADVGAGTGLFMKDLATRVGPEGHVYAVDISPAFVEHLRERARKEGLDQVEAHLCTSHSIDLPVASIDVAFICDVYHHFEYPKSSMASIHDALRDGGEVLLVEFERIPGKSREFIMGHVRAGKDVFVAEILSCGFEEVEVIPIEGLDENYVIRFRKK